MNDRFKKRKPLRLIDRRERWGLTLWGWLVVGMVAGAAIIISIPGIHGFLAIDDPVRGEVLVVEGWIPDHAIAGVVSEFESYGYRMMIAVGGPIALGSHVSGFETYAELARVRLKVMGADEGRLVSIPTAGVTKDRTLESAKAVYRYVLLNLPELKGLDVYTLGAHARRSRLLFKKAFGDGVDVGVIAARDQSYAPDQWWRSSNGVRTVVGELIAYLYAALLSRP